MSVGFPVFDALCQGRIWEWDRQVWSGAAPAVECRLFEGTDVCWFAAQHEMDVLALPVRPPLEALWVEADVYFGSSVFDRVGALVSCRNPEPGDWVCIESFHRVDQETDGPRGVVVKLPFRFFFEFDERGLLPQEPDGTPRAIVQDTTESPGDELDPLREWTSRSSVAVLHVLAALNVRNTIREPAKVSRQVARQRVRQGLPALDDATVLRVPGGGTVPGSRAAAALAAPAKAHHAVLGHFAYYGDTHPDGQPRGLLFGRREGVYWHPPHWRGNREYGEKRHVYKVASDRLPDG